MFSAPLLDSELTMFSCYWHLAVLMLWLTFSGQVRAGRIIGGHEAKPHSRPYMALLQMKTFNNNTRYCDGFLLNEDFVMTAAHCQAKSYEVLLGFHNYHDDRKLRFSVKQAFPHECYSEYDKTNDIMLLKLSSKVKFCNKVKPMTLADQCDRSQPKSCFVSGWGQTSVNDTFQSHILMEVNVTLIHNERCVREKAYCSAGEKGPGPGDSGGPLVCEDGRAYGVVSAKMMLSSGSTLYKYTSIPNTRKWIDSIMNQV